MKTCSKCQIEQSETEFVKSPRYKDGLYPSCKTCRRKSFEAGLASNPMCRRCKTVPHTETHVYCYECHRIMRGQKPEAKFRRDSENKTMCSRCRVEPRAENHRYCRQCHIDYTKEWLKREGALQTEALRKRKVRQVVQKRAQRGKLKRKPCEICGSTKSQFHHLDYKDRTTNIQHVCRPCHVRLEEQKRKLLTNS